MINNSAKEASQQSAFYKAPDTTTPIKNASTFNIEERKANDFTQTFI